MELKICKVFGRQRQVLHRQGFCVFSLQNRPCSVSCVGAGAVLTEIGSESSKFYFHPPSSGQDSPHNSPESSPHGSRLIRINKSSCVDASPISNLVAVGEEGGYLPRLMLFNLNTAVCLNIVHDVHQFGVRFLKFSPSGKYLVSMGTPQDGYVYVWSVEQGLLSLHSSNKCISEVRDLVWLDDAQFVSVGIRHIRIWTKDDGSILNGRNVVLGSACDQTFECALPLPDSASFLVGTTNGSIFSMPESKELVCGQKPVLSMVLKGQMCVISNSTQIIEYFMDSGKLLKPKVTYSASNFIAATEKDTLLVLNDSHRVIKFPFDQEAGESDKISQFLGKKHLQVSSRVSGKSAVLCWNEEDENLLCWPDKLIETSISDITVADCTPSKVCIAGTLSGDVWLDGKCFNAHNGPVTDVSFFNHSFAVSSGRDRSIQIWAKSDTWYLKQTLIFSTPILKAQLLTCSNGEVSLVCCGANKTVYMYLTSGPVDLQNEAAAVFNAAPRTLQLKGMPFDMTAAGTNVAISTNDKLVSIVDPCIEQKVENTWRPVSANGESVNLTRILAVELLGSQYIIGAASNKSVLVFSLQRGECVATQWGHGEPISCLAWYENQVLSASDMLIVSDLKCEESGESSGPPRNSTAMMTPSYKKNESPISKLKLSTSPTGSRPTSPIRKVFETPNTRPRSSSSGRSPPRTLARSPSPPQKSQARSPGIGRAHPLSVGPSADRNMQSLKQPNLSYKPLRLSGSLDPATHDQNATDNLISALEAFLASAQHEESKKPILKSHLLSALQKVDGLAFVNEVSSRLSQQLCNSVEAQINRSLRPN